MRCEERAAVAQTLESSHDRPSRPPKPTGARHLFTTPASLMLDARLTPLERNGRFCACCALPRHQPTGEQGGCAYLTTTPLGQRAGYETARRVLVVLRLTGWISLVGQHRDPLTGHVLSELYQVHERRPRLPAQACALDASLPALLQASIGHENTRWIGWPSIFRQRWRRHLKPPPLPPINSAMTMICPDDAVAGERSNRPTALHRPRKHPGGSGGRPYSSNAGAGT